MKLLLTAATALLLISCGGKKKDGPGGNAQGSSGGEAATLRLNIKPGDAFSQNVVMNINVNTEAMGQTMEMKMGFDAGMKFEVLPGDSAGITNLKVTYSDVSANMDMGALGALAGGKINEMLGKIMNAMSGESLMMGVDNTGKISGPYNAEAFTNSLLDKLDKMDIPRAQAEQFTESMGKKNMENSLQMMFNYLPDHPVKAGETWTKESMQEANNIKMKLKNEYTLDKVADGIAYISMKSTLTNDGESEVQGGKLVDMKMTQTGKMEVRADKGYMKKANVDMKMEGTVESMGVKAPMKMDAKYAITE